VWCANGENIRPLYSTDTKIIAITGKSGETSVNGKSIICNSDAKIVEFDHVVVKPLDLSELYDVTGL
jgi:hypothetical protein